MPERGVSSARQSGRALVKVWSDGIFITYFFTENADFDARDLSEYPQRGCSYMTHAIFNESLKALEKAEHNLKGGFISATANRAYYCCYYCMIALLYSKNVHAKTHQGVHAKFSELFIKTTIFPIETSHDIAVIFDFRQEAGM